MSALKCKQRKIFEVPICTICLDPMTKDLVVFNACGHVFHYNCGLNCHSNSRKCPNCRMRSTELQSLHYVVEEITGVDEQMHQLLNDLSTDQKQQMAKLLADYEEMLHNNQKLIQRNKFLEEKQKSITTEVEQLQKDKIQLIEYNKSIDEKKKDLMNKLTNIQDLYSAIEMDNEQMKEQLLTQTQKLQDYEYLDQINSVIKNNQEDMYVKMIRQKPSQEQNQQIYDLYMIKMGQYKVMEREMKQLQEKVELLEKNNISLQNKQEKLKNTLEELQKENHSIKDFVKYKKDPVQKVTEEIEERTNSALKRLPIKPMSFGSSQLRKVPLNQSMLGKK